MLSGVEGLEGVNGGVGEGEVSVVVRCEGLRKGDIKIGAG